MDGQIALKNLKADLTKDRLARFSWMPLSFGGISVCYGENLTFVGVNKVLKAVSLSLVCLIVSACFSGPGVVINSSDLVIPSENDSTKVYVSAVEELVFINNIRSVLPKIDAIKQSKITSLEKMEKSLKDQLTLLAQAQHLRSQAALTDAPNLNMALALKSAVERNIIASEELLNNAVRAEKAIEDLKKEIRGLESGGREFFDGKMEGEIELGEFVVGKEFRVNLPEKNRYALIIKNKSLTWAFWVDPKTEDQKITLWKYNITGTGCGQCIFGPKNRPEVVVRQHGSQ